MPWYVLLLTQIPAYALYLLYTHILVPFVFGGKSPLSRGTSAPAPAPAAEEPQVSKRQAKQQARSARGPRMQTRRGG